MPQSTWSAKDERQYTKIVASARSRGTPPRRAKEMAARTVNKTRRKQGRTPNKTTQGTGNPQRALDGRSRQELYNRAAELGIRGRSTMNKASLARAIREQQSL